MTILRRVAAALILMAGTPATAAAQPVQQLRIYEIFDANREAFHQRFRDHALRIMARYGFDIVAVWETRTEDGPEFVYVLNWPDEATMRSAWEAFLADEEWVEIKRVTAAEHGTLVGEIEERLLHLTDYSPRLPGAAGEGAQTDPAAGRAGQR